jgi:hypothetical protein
MDELTLVARLRDNNPGGIDLSEPERLLAAEISAATAAGPGRGTRRRRAAGPGRFGPKLVVVGAVAAAVAAAAVIALQNVPAHRARGPSGASADASGLQLASHAAQAAAGAPAWQPNQWIYSDILLPAPVPKPGATNPTIGWTQVDMHQLAYYQNGKLVIRNEVPFLGQTWPVFGQPVTEGDVYAYLQSLPTNPAALRAVIVNNLKTYPQSPFTTGPLAVGTGDYGVWHVISGTLTTWILPPKLLAAVYGVLAANSAVHFDKSVTDNAGQTGVGFYIVQGIFKDEIMINPSTYAYMGTEDFALASQTWHGRLAHDGHTFTRVIRKGEEDWQDLVQSGIVQQPGQTP